MAKNRNSKLITLHFVSLKRKLEKNFWECELHSDDVVLLPLSGSNHLIQLSYLGDHSAQEGPGCGGCGTCGLVEP